MERPWRSRIQTTPCRTVEAVSQRGYSSRNCQQLQYCTWRATVIETESMCDEMLSIERLMPVPLPHAFLAFLSACESGKGDKVGGFCYGIPVQ